MFLTIQELRHNKLKFGALSFIIFLIVFLVLFITGLAAGLANDSGAAIKNTPATHFVLQAGSESRLSRSALTQSDWQALKHQSLTPINVTQATIERPKKQTKTDIAYIAVDATSFMTPKVTQGQKLSNQATQKVVVSSRLQANGYQLGDTFKDSTTGQQFKIGGFSKQMAYAHTPVIYLNHHQWQTIFPTQKTTYNAFASKRPLSVNKHYQVISKQTLIDNIPGYSAEQSSLYLMIGFLYVISLFVLAIFFYIITLQKLRDFGALKALGTTTRYLSQHIISEIGLLTAVAILLAGGIISVIAQSMPASMPFMLTAPMIIGTSVLFLAVAILSALLSLIQVIRIDPITAIGGH